VSESTILTKSRASLLTIARYIDTLDAQKLLCVSVVMLLVFQTSVVLVRYVRHDFSIDFSGSEIHSTLAENMINKGLYSRDGSRPTALRPALYPLFLTPLMKAFSRVDAITFL
jgi:hypothetical protein